MVDWNKERFRLRMAIDREVNQSLRTIKEIMVISDQRMNSEFKRHFLDIVNQQAAETYEKFMSISSWKNDCMNATNVGELQSLCVKAGLVKREPAIDAQMNNLSLGSNADSTDDLVNEFLRSVSKEPVVGSSPVDRGAHSGAMKSEPEEYSFEVEGIIDLDSNIGESNDEECANNVVNAEVPEDVVVDMGNERDDDNVSGGIETGELTNFEREKNGTTSQTTAPKRSCASKVKRFKCDECQKAFSRKSYIRQHMLIHTGEKRFKCDECQKAFSRKGNVRQHMLTHTGEKRFKCDECQKAFSQSCDLQRHLVTHTDEKRFKCDQCQKAFKLKAHLQQHMFTHTGEKRFKCDECQKAYSRRDHLRQHIFIHTGEKRFKCDECQKSFSQKRSLRRHMITHNGKKAKKHSTNEKLRC